MLSKDDFWLYEDYTEFLKRNNLKIEDYPYEDYYWEEYWKYYEPADEETK